MSGIDSVPDNEANVSLARTGGAHRIGIDLLVGTGDADEVPSQLHLGLTGINHIASRDVWSFMKSVKRRRKIGYRSEPGGVDVCRAGRAKRLDRCEICGGKDIQQEIAITNGIGNELALENEVARAGIV